MLSGNADELACAGDDCSAVGTAAHGDPTAAAEVEQPLVAKRTECPQDGVGVHPEYRGQVTRGREPLAGSSFAFGEGPPKRAGDLLVELGVRVAIQLDSQHGASNTSFILSGSNRAP